MTPHYVTVYQISADQAHSSFADLVKIVPVVFGVVFLALSLIFFFGKMRLHWKQPHWLVPICLCTLGLLSLCILAPRSLRQDSDALLAYQNGSYQVIEGAVTDFDPMPYEGHKPECFSVQDKRFCYSDYAIDPGFRNTASHGGPIRSGLQVRIAYKPVTRRNLILRIEIAKDQIASLK